MRLLGIALVAGSYGTQQDLCQMLCKADGPSVCTGGSWNKAGFCHGYVFRGPPANDEYCYHTAATAGTCPSKGVPVKVSDVPRLLARGTAHLRTTSTTTTGPLTMAAATTITTGIPTSTSTSATTSTSTSTTTAPVDRSRNDRLAALVRLIHADNPQGYVYLPPMRRAEAFREAYSALARESSAGVRHGFILGELIGEPFEGPAKEREIMNAITAQLFDPQFGLFSLSSEVPYFVFINPAAPVGHPDYINMFRAVGRFFGLALARNAALGVSIPATFWARILDQPLQLADIQKDEPILFRSLEYMLSAPAEELEDMPITIDGVVYQPRVDNRAELVDRKVNSLIDPQVGPLLAEIKQGLNDVIDIGTIRQYLSATDLREVFIGSSFIDIDDLRAHSTMSLLDRRVGEWLFNVLHSFDQEMRKKFLKFATNLEHLPVGGFRQIEPRINFVRTAGDGGRFPRAAHCFNSIFIPSYTSEDQLREKLTGAILGSKWGM